MRELIVTEFITLDGVVEAPGGEPTHAHTGWVFDFFSDEIGDFKLQETLDAEAHVLGRVTYESFAGAWPHRHGEMADKINTMPKYVATTTLDELEWSNSTAIRGDVPRAIEALKREGDGGPLLVAGSRTLVQTLIAHDLVDELRLMVFPVLLGSGMRLFADDSPDKRTFALADSRTFDNGVQLHSYRRPS